MCVCVINSNFGKDLLTKLQKLIVIITQMKKDEPYSLKLLVIFNLVSQNMAHIPISIRKIVSVNSVFTQSIYLIL